MENGAKRKRKVGEGTSPMEVDSGVEGSSQVPKVKRNKVSDDEMRKVPIPPYRFTPLRENWLKIFTPIVDLQIRFNLKSRNAEIKTSKETEDIANLEKAADFVKAFVLGFEVDDPLAMSGWTTSTWTPSTSRTSRPLRATTWPGASEDWLAKYTKN